MQAWGRRQEDVSGTLMYLNAFKKKNREEIKPERCYLLFEEVPLLQGERIRLGNNWDNVDHLTETSHEFYIKRPQTEKERDNMRERELRDM